VIDQGSVVSGERNTTVREAELELKDGNQKDLFLFARKIEAVAPIRFGVRSKAEKGFVLIEQQKSAFKAERLNLDRSMHASDAFQTIAASCFRHFRLNEDVLLRWEMPKRCTRHAWRCAGCARPTRSSSDCFQVPSRNA
jgi:inorganic triphosphatase YgiF